jgi:glycosyltransferase involved in cell wall biosynthesis
LTNKITAIFVSKYLKNITSRFYLFNKNAVVPNFLSNQFTSIRINTKRKPIFVWSVQREKGLKETIQTWINQIYPSNNKAKLYIIGIKKKPTWFNSKIFLKKNIHFFGRVNKKKLKDIYQKSMGMICLGYDETFCLNALEANSCGLPVITFGKTALGEMIVDKKNGFVINDFNDLGKKINDLIHFKKKQRINLIKNSVQNSNKYNIKNIIYLWLKLLK